LASSSWVNWSLALSASMLVFNTCHLLPVLPPSLACGMIWPEKGGD